MRTMRPQERVALFAAVVWLAVMAALVLASSAGHMPRWS